MGPVFIGPTINQSSRLSVGTFCASQFKITFVDFSLYCGINTVYCDFHQCDTTLSKKSLTEIRSVYSLSSQIQYLCGVNYKVDCCSKDNDTASRTISTLSPE
jgi:hypothetical protein